ncbi:MAG TPA: hypothetical protein GX510_02060 [Firmicutes bacterium]|nr:hypothetical protein [Candidatus Fermentithermobacillaceae bacterium]
MFREDDRANRKNTARSYLGLVTGYLKANISMEMEYRASFATRVLGMLLNDCMWLAFWVLYFTRFPALSGWERNDVVALWAVTAFGYGIAYSIFGNSVYLARIIINGDLDFYLVYPKDVLLHVLCSRMDVTALGDTLFGPLVYFAIVRPGPGQGLLFFLSGLAVAMILLGFTVIAHSLAFFIGNSETLASQLLNALITFSTYPSEIFQGAVRAILFTLVPAGFINSIPVRVMREQDPAFFAAVVLAAVVLVLGGRGLFRLGLKRYESGNLVRARV